MRAVYEDVFNILRERRSVAIRKQAYHGAQLDLNYNERGDIDMETNNQQQSE